jgi:hypothetical protein
LRLSQPIAVEGRAAAQFLEVRVVAEQLHRPRLHRQLGARTQICPAPMFSKDGKLMLAGGAVQVWDVAKRDLLVVLNPT